MIHVEDYASGRVKVDGPRAQYAIGARDAWDHVHIGPFNSRDEARRNIPGAWRFSAEQVDRMIYEIPPSMVRME